MKTVFINCRRFPWVSWIVGGLKQYETRTRNTLRRLVGERVLLAQTGRGAPLIVASAVIAEVVAVRSRDEWEDYLQFTWVPVGSEYDWKPHTKVKYLYRMADVRPVQPFRMPAGAVRHGRVWAEF